MSARSTGGQAPDAPGTEASGVVLVDKPQGWTSHDVVGRVRRLAGTRKVGHAGTLDPMATGLLVVGVNKATRLLTAITGTDKTYTATIRLGQSTVTDDAEGEVVQTRLANAVTPERVAEQVAALTGEILQVPSAVSNSSAAIVSNPVDRSINASSTDPSISWALCSGWATASAEMNSTGPDAPGRNTRTPLSRNAFSSRSAVPLLREESAINSTSSSWVSRMARTADDRAMRPASPATTMRSSARARSDRPGDSVTATTSVRVCFDTATG